MLLQKTIPLEGLFQRGMRSDGESVVSVGYDEDTYVIGLSTMISIFIVQFDLMQIKHISKSSDIW